MTDPRSEYETRLRLHESKSEELERWDARFSLARLIFGSMVLVFLWFGFGSGLSLALSLLALLCLAGTIAGHVRMRRRLSQARRASRFYRRGLLRLEGKWSGHGQDGARWRPGDHIYATDLDLFGGGSLFQLLCGARTEGGERMLAEWLCTPAQIPVIRRRQEAVRELRDKLDLREDLAVLGDDVQAEIHPELLGHWAGAPGRLEGAGHRVIAFVLVLMSGLSLLAWTQTEIGPVPLIVSLSVQCLFALRHRRQVIDVISGVDQPAHDLRLLSKIMARLEDEEFSSPLLIELRRSLQTARRPPSQEISRLARLIDLLDSRRNQMFLPVSYLLLWATQTAFSIEAWRMRCGPQVGRWLQAIGELEALSSLGAFSFENPDFPFPGLSEDEVIFSGSDMGHPLLATDRRVPNSVQLGDDLRLLVVSGSNMSGKTTLLRTVGVNVVLALAGAPVCARELRLSRFDIGTSVVVTDSLQEGISRFYAEIRKLRRVFELTESGTPVLFLLDEILHGTNSHDRAIGAEALVRSLTQRGAVGLVTTHDLALTRVAGALDQGASNVHFEDHFEAGHLVFDYLLKPGVVQKSNALDLMRSVGLEV